MKTITTYVHGSQDSLMDDLAEAGFSEDAAYKGSFATYELKLEIDFDDNGEVLDTRLIKP